MSDWWLRLGNTLMRPLVWAGMRQPRPTLTAQSRALATALGCPHVEVKPRACITCLARAIDLAYEAGRLAAQESPRG